MFKLFNFLNGELIINLVYSGVTSLFPFLKKVKLDDDLCDLFVVSDDLANH